MDSAGTMDTKQWAVLRHNRTPQRRSCPSQPADLQLLQGSSPTELLMDLNDWALNTLAPNQLFSAGASLPRDQAAECFRGRYGQQHTECYTIKDHTYLSAYTKPLSCAYIMRGWGQQEITALCRFMQKDSDSRLQCANIFMKLGLDLF